jgi:hypothetical protein
MEESDTLLSSVITLPFLVRLGINLGAMVVLIRVIYQSVYRKKDLHFTFYLLNFLVFLLTFVLSSISSFSSMGQLGGAFSLAAAFSLLRFRTETLSAKDMTYIFIVMAIGMINAVVSTRLIEIMALNAMIVGFVFIVDGNLLMKNQKTKSLDYGDIENIRPENHDMLIADLKAKTGLSISRIEIEELDLKKGSARIRIFYY